MSEWITRIQRHAAWEKLRSLRGLLEGIEVRPDDSTEAVFDLARLRQVVETIENRLLSADPILLFPGPIGPIESHIQNATIEVTAFNGNRNRGHLSNANAQIDSLLSYAVQLGLFASQSPPEAVEALETIRSQAEQTLRILMESEKTLSSQLSNLQESALATNSEVSSQKARLDNAIAEYQTQFSSAEASRQQQAIDAIKTHTQRLDKALLDAQARLQTVTQEVSKRLEAVLQDATTKSVQQQESLNISGTEVLNHLEEMRQKAENLLHVIGSTGMAGEYQKVANSARKTTLIWQAIAAIAMCGLILFAVLTYVATQSADDIQWGGVAARAFVTLTFGIVAAYAARQGDRYSDVEIHNRRYQLELSSLDPYLANLPQETQNKLKEELAKKLFGNAGSDVVVRAREVSGTGKDPLEMALQVLLEFAKKRV